MKFLQSLVEQRLDETLQVGDVTIPAWKDTHYDPYSLTNAYVVVDKKPYIHVGLKRLKDHPDDKHIYWLTLTELHTKYKDQQILSDKEIVQLLLRTIAGKDETFNFLSNRNNALTSVKNAIANLRAVGRDLPEFAIIEKSLK